MAGVIIDGVQWEHCHVCSKYIRLEDLGYERPTAQHHCGRDLCVTCVDTGIKAGDIEFDNVQPAKTWCAYEV